MKNSETIIIQLNNILISMYSILMNMLELEDKKYESIKNVDFISLNHLNEKEEELVGLISSFESKRQDVIDHLSLILGFDPSLTVTQVIHKLPIKSQEIIKNSCIDIRKVCDRIAIASERNHYILHSHTEIFSQILDIVAGDNGMSDQYNYFGSSVSSHEASLNLLDQIV
ncbi:MAG: flagellar export chaperone FlgN [Brevinema sp.]